MLYRGRSVDPLRVRLLEHKFFVDEIYAKIVAVCQDGVAKVVQVVDILLVDGLGVRGLSGLAAVVGSGFRRLQSGNLQAYSFLFGVGVLLLIFIALARA